MASKRDNLLYRLRKKGIRALTRERIIFLPFDGEPFELVQVRRLCKEFRFHVQLEIQKTYYEKDKGFNSNCNIYSRFM